MNIKLLANALILFSTLTNKRGGNERLETAQTLKFFVCNCPLYTLYIYMKGKNIQKLYRVVDAKVYGLRRSKPSRESQ
jgi:hypothetical protein